MKKVWFLFLGMTILLFVIGCTPKEAGEEGALVGAAKMLPSIKPTCSYLVSPAGSFKLTKEWDLEDGIFGNAAFLADDFDESKLTSGCLGFYNLRSCNSVDYINSFDSIKTGENPGGHYWNSPFVWLGIVKLPEGVTESTISEMVSSKTALVLEKEKFEIKYDVPGGVIENVWKGKNHLLWVSGDLLIEVVGPLAQVDWSLFDAYYQKYPPTG